MKFGVLVALAFSFFDSFTAQGTSKDYPPGWNGLSMVPPMGWRSWNAFGANINNATIASAIDAITAKIWDVAGHSAKVSFADLGYKSVGIDEGWENCSGADPNHGLRQHDEDGFPMVNVDKFPDLKWLVDYGHAKNLSMGWYLNGCACGERQEREVNYKGDVQRLHEYGFDGVKLDGCGAATNMTKYAMYMAETKRAYTIENCHWGHCGADSWYHNPDGSSCPTQTWAPFNWFRTSGDINSGAMSWFNNLQTTIKFQDYAAPLSRPGVWAYPDMLEVGRVQEPAPGTFYSWNRAHFGAWCVTSSPLVLGMNLADEKLQQVVDVIANAEAIEINQQWSGHPGMFVETISSPPVPYDPKGASIPTTAGGDFDISQGWTSHGASVVSGPKDNSTSGAANIRSGHPADVSLIRFHSGLIGNGHSIDSVSMSFRYTAGYTPKDGKVAKAPTVRVLLVNADNKELTTLLTTGPLGNYSADTFIGYSPPIVVDANGLNVNNDDVVFLAMEVTNNDRNLQIPIDDLAAGFNVRIKWAQSNSSKLVGDSPLGIGQLWAKRQPGGSMAALVINHSPSEIKNYSIDFKKLNLTGTTYAVRDVWAHTDNGTAANQLTLNVPAYDSAFILLSPSTSIIV